MTLTLAQAETLKALSTLGTAKFHTVHNVVKARAKVRPGKHDSHFKNHWGLMINKTTDKLMELKDSGHARSGRGSKKTDTGWMTTPKGRRAAKEL